jgi:hypothetical protein
VREQIATTNSIIQRLDDQKHVFYLDIGAKFLDETGGFAGSFQPASALHTAAGLAGAGCAAARAAAIAMSETPIHARTPAPIW